MREESTKDKKYASGQMLVEVLLALAIIVMAVSSVVAVYFGGRSLLTDAQTEDVALNYARQDLESVKSSAQSNFAALTSASSTTGNFLREQIITPVDGYTKKVICRISWVINPLRTAKVELSAILTDWRGASKTGNDTGGGGLTGNWLNPITLGSVDLGPGNSATGLDVKNKIVYLSSTASDNKKPDFYIVDATNGQNPVIVSSLDTGPGLNAVDTAGTYAYVANSDTNAQLQIIDVSNLTSPVLISSYKLPGISGTGAVGNSIFYYNSKIYFGTKRATGPEFHIIDVSNPSNPIELGNFETNADVNSIRVTGNTAYLATSDNAKEAMVLNVSDPASISLTGSFDASSDDDGQSIYLVGNKLYLGRAGGSNDFIIADAASSTAITQLSSTNLGGVSVNGIVVRDYLAFLGTSASNSEFQVWNISTSTNPTLWSSFNFPQIITGIDYEDNRVYVSVRSNDALRIITSQ